MIFTSPHWRAALLAAALVMGCAAGGAPATEVTARSPRATQTLATGSAGAFLAGRLAASETDTALAADAVEMRNLIGDGAGDWARLLADPANHLHLYGKGEARPGRKMGHVTRLSFGPAAQ